MLAVHLLRLIASFCNSVRVIRRSIVLSNSNTLPTFIRYIDVISSSNPGALEIKKRGMNKIVVYLLLGILTLGGFDGSR
jgi:hypothetical protein